MIEKMKKYQFLIYHKDYQPFLIRLRELGVVHVTQKQFGTPPEGSELAGWMEREKRFSTVIKALHKINEDHDVQELTPANKELHDLALLEKIESLFNERDELLLHKQGILKEIGRINPLGDFSPKTIIALQEKGWFLNFYTTTETKFNPAWIEEYDAIRLNTVGSQLYFATLTRDASLPPIDAEFIRLSEKSITEWNNELKIAHNRCEEIDWALQKIAKNDIETLRYYDLKIKDHINFEKVDLSADTAAENRLMLLEGYVPEKEEEKTSLELLKSNVYFEISSPTPKDNVPIKLKNNRFARVFEMIADLYDRPNYNAFDLTPFFAPFYVIFFGLCLGDCGYGLVILLASFFLKKKANSDFMRSAGQLATYLGIGTMLFGFVSGTFFGIPLLEQGWSWLQPLKGIIMNSDQLFIFALVCGAIQITYALIIKAITTWMRYGFLYSLDTFGWLLVLIGNVIVFVLGKQQIIEPAIQTTAHYAVSCTGGFLMLLFNSPEKGLKGIPGSIGSGLFGLYNKISGILGDMLSYIRLFALGISGSVMGLVFNQLAVGLAPDTIIIRQLVMIAILLFGHGINIFINGLGAFIHPMRLTFVEFYNNAGFEGGGKAYSPFKKQTD